MTNKTTYITRTDQIAELSDEERAELAPVCDEFAFRSNSYYMGLINWDDPADPIRRVAVPVPEELEEWGDIDASGEHSYTVMPGLEHKYKDTAVLLVNNVCGAVCRFCFRKRLFMAGNDEVVRDITNQVEYIRKHRGISNVLLTGGDSLLLSTNRLDKIVEQLFAIDHVHIVRLGSKMPAFNPYRILDDPSLMEMIKRHTKDDKHIYLMAHFNNAAELTDQAIEALGRVHRAGAVVVNQTPIVAGLNDNVGDLLTLFNELAFAGVPPYYVFQCRPTVGNKPYAVPIERAYEVFLEAQNRCSGLAKRARFVMSHATGKIEVVGLDDNHIFMRYHQAADPEDAGRFMVFERRDDAYWLDDYAEAGEVGVGRDADGADERW